MLNKIYEKTKDFIKNNYKTLLIMLFLIVIFNIKLDYDIYSPGGLLNIDDRIEVENSDETSGSYNLTYVSAKKGILPFVLLSYVIKDWDLVSLDEERIEDESYEEIVERNKIYLEEGMNNSVIAAFDEAGETYKINSSKVKVLYILSDAETSLKVGDEIVSVEGNKVNKSSELIKIIQGKNVGDNLTIKVIRNEKEKEVTAEVKEIENEKIIGIMLVNIYDIDTFDKINIKYKNNEGGSSGGLMNALYIYDALVKEDLRNGLKIAGTGTIDELGNVGEIGGIKYKLLGASKNNADIFITPNDNYEEALKVRQIITA